MYSVYRIFLSFDKDKSDAIDVFELRQVFPAQQPPPPPRPVTWYI